MTTLLAWTMVVISVESMRLHFRQATQAHRGAFRWYSLGLVLTWAWMGIAYVLLGVGQPVSTVGPLIVRPALALLGALHIGRIRSWQRGEG